MLFRPLQRLADTAFGVFLALVAVNAICSTAMAQTSPTDPRISAPSPFDSAPPSVPANQAANDEYVVYPFKLINGGGSAINFIRITGSVTHTFSAPTGFAAAFDVISPAPFTCTASPTATSISFSCTGSPPGDSLASGQTLNLPIAFRLPKTRIVNERIDFIATAQFREGNSRGPGGNNDSALTAKSTTPVGEVDNNKAAAVIPLQTTGARFFTGTKGIPQGGSDRVGTLVEAPVTGTGTYAVGTIVEASVPCPVPGVTSCTDTIDLSIVDANGTKQRFEVSPYLVIYLRLDASVIPGNFNNKVIYHNAGTGFEAVPPCANGADPLAGMERCVLDRRVFKKNDPEVKADPSLLGDGQATNSCKRERRIRLVTAEIFNVKRRASRRASFFLDQHTVSPSVEAQYQTSSPFDL